jgi:hypothetical protein
MRTGSLLASDVCHLGLSVTLQKSHSLRRTWAPRPIYPPQSAEFDVDAHIVTLLQDMKEMLGNGHALGRLLATFKKLIYHLDQVPVVLMDDINKAIPDSLK